MEMKKTEESKFTWKNCRLVEKLQGEESAFGWAEGDKNCNVSNKQPVELNAP